jgi:hypothetical protein
MVFGSVSREGRSPLVVLESGSRLNQFTYIQKGLIPQRKNLADLKTEGDAIFYQDKAPCHASGRVQDFLRENFPAFIPNAHMPPNCPDGNVLDYCVWSLLKERLNKYGLVSNFAKLKEILKKEWNVIPQDVIRDAIDSW